MESPCSGTSESQSSGPYRESPPTAGHQSASMERVIVRGRAKNVHHARFRGGILKLETGRGACAVASQPQGGTRGGRVRDLSRGSQRAGASIFFFLAAPLSVCGSRGPRRRGVAGLNSAGACARYMRKPSRSHTSWSGAASLAARTAAPRFPCERSPPGTHSRPPARLGLQRPSHRPAPPRSRLDCSRRPLCWLRPWGGKWGGRTTSPL